MLKSEYMQGLPGDSAVFCVCNITTTTLTIIWNMHEMGLNNFYDLDVWAHFYNSKIE